MVWTAGEYSSFPKGKETNWLIEAQQGFFTSNQLVICRQQDLCHSYEAPYRIFKENRYSCLLIYSAKVGLS